MSDLMRNAHYEHLAGSKFFSSFLIVGVLLLQFNFHNDQRIGLISPMPSTVVSVAFCVCFGDSFVFCVFCFSKGEGDIFKIDILNGF